MGAHSIWGIRLDLFWNPVIFFWSYFVVKPMAKFNLLY